MLYDHQEYIDSTRGLAIKDYHIVTGIPGSRTDLLVGWLSLCHPQFHMNHEWAIDPNTGASMVMPTSVFNQAPDDLDCFDYEIISQQQIEKLRRWIPHLMPTDPMASRSVVGKSHMRPWTIVEAIGPERFVQDFKIIAVDTTTLSNKSLNDKLVWEFIAKTFLSNCRRALNISDAKVLKMQSPKVKPDDNYRARLGKYSTQVQDRIIFLDYEKIITPEGGEYICDRLGLELDETAISAWKKILPITNTNTVINVNGERWSLDRIMSADQ